MSYVSKAISDEERLISLARAHWIYVLTGFFWLGLFVGIGMAVDYKFQGFLGQFTYDFLINLRFGYISGGLSPVSVLMTIIGLMAAWPFFRVYITTEIGLTNTRIIYKTGLLFVEVDQVDLEDIRAENVYHGLLGWLLGYGSIRLDCRFIEDVKLPAIRNPYRFVKASHNARIKHPNMAYGEDEFAGHIVGIERQQYSNTPKERLKNMVKVSFQKSS